MNPAADDPETRKKEAEARAAEAEAKRAEAAAAAAQIAAEKAALEKAEWESPLAKKAREAALREKSHVLDDDVAKEKLEAEARKAIAAAEKAAADAEAAQISSLIPDFSKVDRGATEMSGEKPVAASALAQVALRKAADDLVKKLGSAIDEGETILITTDPDLASTDAVYLAVVTGLDNLIAAADRVLKPAGAPKAFLRLETASLATAVASAVPGLLSLFSAKRALSTFGLDPNTNAAVAAVSGALLSAETNSVTVTLDDFRLVVNGTVAEKERSLFEKLGELRRDPKKPGVEELIKAITPFLAALHEVPDGAKRSPLALASLREQLHPKTSRGKPDVAKVLFLRASGGSATQLLDDRPMLFDDKLHLIASASIAYWLLDTAGNDIVASGLATGWSEIRGKVGEALDLSVRT